MSLEKVALSEKMDCFDNLFSLHFNANLEILHTARGQRNEEVSRRALWNGLFGERMRRSKRQKCLVFRSIITIRIIFRFYLHWIEHSVFLELMTLFIEQDRHFVISPRPIRCPSMFGRTLPGFSASWTMRVVPCFPQSIIHCTCQCHRVSSSPTHWAASSFDGGLPKNCTKRLPVSPAAL